MTEEYKKYMPKEKHGIRFTVAKNTPEKNYMIFGCYTSVLKHNSSLNDRYRVSDVVVNTETMNDIHIEDSSIEFYRDEPIPYFDVILTLKYYHGGGGGGGTDIPDPDMP